MNRFFKITWVAACLLFALVAPAQTTHKYLRKGDKAYEKGSYSDAELNYRRALEKESTSKGQYNLGNSTYRQERFDEAIKHFEAAANEAKDPQTKARAYHNLGNAYFQKGKLPESIDAYKNALRLAPNDAETKRNLANALRRKQQEQQQQQQQSETQNNKNQQQDDQNQQENQPNQQQPNQPQQGDDPNGENEKEENQERSGSDSQPENLNKEEARQLLEIMDREEQKVQQKLRKAQSGSRKPQKDW